MNDVPADEPLQRPPFELATEPADNGTGRVRVSGELDMATAPQLVAAVSEHLAAGRRRLLLDFSDVSFMDSTGLGSLLELRQEAEALAIVGSQAVHKVVSLVRLQGPLGLCDSVAEAEAHLGGVGPASSAGSAKDMDPKRPEDIPPTPAPTREAEEIRPAPAPTSEPASARPTPEPKDGRPDEADVDTSNRPSPFGSTPDVPPVEEKGRED